MNYFKNIKRFFFFNKKHNKAFKKLKEELSNDTFFAFYDPNKDLQLVTDAINHAVSGDLL